MEGGAGRASLSGIVQLDEFPTRFADALESAAARIRAVTADRLETWIRRAAAVAVLAALALVALAFLLVAAHRVLAIWLGSAGSLAVLGGLFLVAGLFTLNRGNERSRGDG